MFVLLCLAYFTKHNDFKVHPFVAFIKIPFLSLAKWNSTVCVHHVLFIREWWTLRSFPPSSYYG